LIEFHCAESVRAFEESKETTLLVWITVVLIQPIQPRSKTPQTTLKSIIYRPVIPFTVSVSQIRIKTHIKEKTAVTDGTHSIRAVIVTEAARKSTACFAASELLRALFSGKVLLPMVSLIVKPS
jgi:hypothetical protein